jgi:hypothetical protein
MSIPDLTKSAQPSGPPVDGKPVATGAGRQGLGVSLTLMIAAGLAWLIVLGSC